MRQRVPLWVNRVTLTTRRSFPVFPDKQTCPEVFGSVTPPVLIELGLKSLRQPRGLAFGRRVTARAGHAGGATVAGEGAIAPGATGMLFANPAAILALGAFHRSLRACLRSLSAFCMRL